MLITIKASEAGKIKHELQPGSIINQGDLLASLELKDPSKVKKIATFDGELTYTKAPATDETTLQAFRSSKRALDLVMDGYVVETEPLVQKMLSSLQSIELVLAEVQDAAAALGNKLPAELDEKLQQIYAATKAAHVDGEDAKETDALVSSLKSTIAGFIGELYESKQAEMTVTLSPVTAVLDTYAAGLREHAIAVVCDLLQRFMAVENNFAPQPSKDQAIAELVKVNAESLDVVYSNALAHEALPARTELAISLLRQLSSFPERFGVEPLTVLPPEMDVIVELSQLSGQKYSELALTAALRPDEGRSPSRTCRQLKQELLSGADSAAVSPRPRRQRAPRAFGDAEGQVAMQVAVSASTAPTTSSRWRRRRTAPPPSPTSSIRRPTRRRTSRRPSGRSGVLAVVPDISSLNSELPKLLGRYVTAEPINTLHVALGSGIDGGAAEDDLIATAAQTLQASAAALNRRASASSR